MLRAFNRLVSAATIVAGLIVAGCSQYWAEHASVLPAPMATDQTPAWSPSTPFIKHVIIMVQENRSFDNLFATFPGADGAKQGMSHGGPVKLAAAKLAAVDFEHVHRAFVLEYDGGKMDGFDAIRYSEKGGIFKPAGLLPYQYVAPIHVAPYWALARQYVLADHLFQTQSSGSFTGHQDLIAGGTPYRGDSIIDDPTAMPWGCDAPRGTVTSLIEPAGKVLYGQGPFPCFAYRTLRDGLDAKHITWKYYAPAFVKRSAGYLWNAFDAIRAVRRGPEWSANVSIPETTIFNDIDGGTLPAVSWLIPDYNNSDHPGESSDTGPSWVAQVVNAVGKSQYWKSTAIVIVWDDWGGFYDHVKPPQLDYQGLGFRVPCLIVSPYAKKGYVAHTQYEFGSILKFIENNWGLARIGTTDKRATSIIGAFNFARPPRAFVPIAAKYSRSFFERQRPSGHDVDDE